jgi:glucokinase
MVIAALDIGGTKMAACIADASGPRVRVVAPTVLEGGNEAVARQGLQMIAAAALHIGVDATAIREIGVSSAGPFEQRDGRQAILPPNMCGGIANGDDLPNDWTHIPLEAVLRERFDTIRIANDCVAGLQGERAFGAAQREPNAIYVTWSTGIGFGLCVDGHVLQGKHGNAGHAGHMLMSELSDALCGCGNRGDLEGMIAGRNLGNRVGRPLAELFAAARGGDHAALDIVHDAARLFGRALYNLTAILDTRCILVGGSVWRQNQDLLQPLVQAEVSSRYPALTMGVTVHSAALDELVTDMGALAMVMPDDWFDDWRARRPWEPLSSIALA